MKTEAFNIVVHWHRTKSENDFFPFVRFFNEVSYSNLSCILYGRISQRLAFSVETNVSKFNQVKLTDFSVFNSDDSNECE